jgi:eukaryotic-like serine/threonine-protein kinase
MNLGRYQVSTQTGAGRDGLRYRAENPESGTPVEIRVLSAARTDPTRWAEILRRLKKVALVQHPGLPRPLTLAIEHDPPYVVWPWIDAPTLADALRPRLPLSATDAATLVFALADALAAAHRLGLVHGRLSPGQIWLKAPADVAIDITGLDVCTALPDPARRALEAACRAPELRDDSEPDSAVDVFSLGAIARWLLGGQTDPSARGGLVEARASASTQADAAADTATLAGLDETQADHSPTLCALIAAMLAAEPADRPTMREVAQSLRPPASSLAATNALESLAIGPSETAAATSAIPWPMTLPVEPAGMRGRLGRFHLLERLGRGGMGEVFRAEDMSDGSIVAIKVLRADLTNSPVALRRFHKEARLLAEIKNPFVTNLIDVNEDDDIHYLVLEFVAGESLDHRLERCGRLAEPEALQIMVQVAQALEDAHESGIVHRDIKPHNILLVDRPNGEPAEGRPSAGDPLRVKLSDFGLARHTVQTESLEMTQAGAILGTPLYMAPEQCSGNDVTPRADIYAMGCTLFHILSGRPPFLADTPMAVIAKHNSEPPPELKTLNPAASDGICQVIAKALAKAPEHRYSGAKALRRDLERLLRGEPTSLGVHPHIPAFEPADVMTYDWVWQLAAGPRQLWPLVSNTERINRIVGMPAVAFTNRPEPDGRVRRFGRFRWAGIPVSWEEHPFEWVEGQRMGILREYPEGFWKWLVSIVELAPRAGGGTTLTHRLRIAPRGLLGRVITALMVGRRGHRAFDAVYRRIDAAAGGQGASPLFDPFEPADALSADRRRRLDARLDRLIEQGADANVVDRLGAFLASAPAQEVAHIRPIALARRLGLDADKVVAACLLGAREGVLVMLWDLLCPICRIPSEVRETLRSLKEHGHCEACQLDYALDFANSIEVIFRVHPDIRPSELRTYCIGGPAHSPHVVAQARLAPGERLELDLNLDEGQYRLRGPQLPFSHEFRVQAAAPRARCELELAHSPGPDVPRTLRSGGQVFALGNEGDQELVVRIERTAPRDDALTAARASSLALFRRLFPGEVLAPGQLVSVADVTLLVTALDRPARLYAAHDDAEAFHIIHDHFRLIEDRVRDEGGALVKTIGEATLSTFPNPASALRAALALAADLATEESTRPLPLKLALHRGMAMAATLNEHLDYFGQTVNLALRLPELAAPGELILTPQASVDPQLAALLLAKGLEAHVVPGKLAGMEDHLFHRVVVSA